MEEEGRMVVVGWRATIRGGIGGLLAQGRESSWTIYLDLGKG